MIKVIKIEIHEAEAELRHSVERSESYAVSRGVRPYRLLIRGSVVRSHHGSSPRARWRRT